MKTIKIKYTALFTVPALLFVLTLSMGGCKSEETIIPTGSRIYNQVDQMGRPAINTVFVGNGALAGDDSTKKNTFNSTIPSAMQSAFLNTFIKRLRALNPGYTTNLLGLDSTTFCTVLVNDYLTASKVGITTFYNGTQVLTGRALSDDVIDVELTLIFGGPNGMQNPCLTSDHVNANDKPFLTSFPYLAAPW